LSPREPDFDHIDLICAVAASAGAFDGEIRQIEDLARSGTEALSQSRDIEARLVAHKALEQESKDMKFRIKATENRKDELVEAARAKISTEKAKEEILARLHRLPLGLARGYIRGGQLPLSRPSRLYPRQRKLRWNIG
jgi:type I restriction enzyme M protein